jgi:hypothetical protein
MAKYNTIADLPLRAQFLINCGAVRLEDVLADWNTNPPQEKVELNAEDIPF